MKTLHIDCTFGIAGDMLLAALVDLGADLEGIAASLRRLPIDPFTLETRPVDRCGIRARLLDIALEPAGGVHPHDHGHEHVHGHAGHPLRRAGDILTMVADADLPPRVRRRATAIFTAIAQAEGRIHGIDPAEVHLHEVGAMDSIIDILGVCLALEALDIDTITATPVPVGYGVVTMVHGRFPIPAPATLELLKGVPLSDFDAPGELTTPTGAAFLGVLVERFGGLPAGRPLRIGYGAGNRDSAHPNVLRSVLFEAERSSTTAHDDEPRESIAVLECQLDDVTGEQLGHLMGLLLEAGALDVFYTPVTMKKSRPGTLITVLAPWPRADAQERLLLLHTSTFGVRRHESSRRILDRRIEVVETEWGEVRVKIGSLDGRDIRVAPEYDDIHRLALEHDHSLADVHARVLEAYALRGDSGSPALKP
ncbi:nickel pincer cofactor biosynthesis protein LarC [Salinicola corii]|uniref:Putative nickel insertion protein n=1 Tax=Salinicola corii TaxID=2606937 RepID=A0A640WH64_9GAMM|nr:nickel pincer cofactor biosynthesis protein LarC [Salinicola corii]KAA0019649.1 nickel pincer cofactor biosynthesis protein LarC [Salinicola corii]